VGLEDETRRAERRGDEHPVVTVPGHRLRAGGHLVEDRQNEGSFGSSTAELNQRRIDAFEQPAGVVDLHGSQFGRCGEHPCVGGRDQGAGESRLCLRWAVAASPGASFEQWDSGLGR